MLARDRFEEEYGIVFDKYRYGSTIWSPLCQGILTGKYNKELPPASRMLSEDIPERLKSTFRDLFSEANKEKTLKKFNDLENIAKELGGTMAQLAMAWAINNTNVSTAITGCSKPEQLEDTVGAVRLYKLLTPEIEKRIEEILQNKPKTEFCFKSWVPRPNRRDRVLKY